MRGAKKSRRFAFFDKVEPNVEKNERAFQDLPVTCASSGGGYLWLGDVDGFMHCLDATFMFASFRAHNAGPVRLCQQVPGMESHLLVTVGVSSDDSTSATRREEELVCVWNTKKWSLTSKTSFPVCCRSVRTTAATAATASATLDEVVCLEVASTMDVILLGHTSGAVQLIKGDITSDRHCRRLILHEFASPVTNLHYVAAPSTSTNVKRHKGRHAPELVMQESDSGSISSASPLITKPTPSSAYIYAASENKLVSIKLGKKDEAVRTTVLDAFGCRRNCSCLVADPEKSGRKILAMTHKEAVYFYDPDGRGPCLAIVGNKQAIAVYKNYLVSIRCNKIAESDKYSEEELAHIHRRYADHLFNQKQYDLAVKEYIQTIGTVEASYVVLRFLESGLITHLVRYLEALVASDNMAHGRLTKDHTALLLNSYARLDDKERIDAFLDVSSPSFVTYPVFLHFLYRHPSSHQLQRLASLPKVGSEFYSCINVLRRAGYPHQALRLAQITDNHADCIQILTEDLKDAGAALKEINSLPFDQALEAVCTHGALLMQNAPSETAELLDRLCSNPTGGRISASRFIKIFVNNRLGLMKFLERYIEKSTSSDACLTDVVETLLELLLYEVNEVASDEVAEDKDARLAHLRGLIMRLLEDPKATYDEGKALILCKQRNFLPGCLYIWMKNKQYDQIMEHYILEDNFEAILKACEEYGDEVPSLWFEAFKYAADKPQLGEKLPRLLSGVIEAPKRGERLVDKIDLFYLLFHCPSTQKAYFLRYLESGKEKVEANEAEMQRLREETLRNREIARQSKTRCFDTYSSDDQLCPECAPLIRYHTVGECTINHPRDRTMVHGKEIFGKEGRGKRRRGAKVQFNVGVELSGRTSSLSPRPSQPDRRGLMEVGKTTSQLTTPGSAELLAELEQSLILEKADLSTTLSKAIAKGIASKPSSSGTTKLTSQPPKPLSSTPSLPRMLAGTASKNPFDDLPASKAVTLGDSGRGESLPSGVKQSSTSSIGSAIDTGVVLPTRKVSKVASNPFGEDDDDEEAGDAGGKRVTKVTNAPVATYPQHLNPF
ncbi:hypothetical protein TSMEX_008270 [Taenia solium]|eukprot:TsM_000890600 transcript=TsM_000890600 gene=TsM_000890600